MRYLRFKNFLAFSLGLAVLSGCASVDADKKETKLTAFVDPFIGSGEHGHVFVGANVPFGFVQLGPTQLSTGWDWCSGYHYSDSTIIGFGHQHLSGTGIGELGDISLMPAVGKIITTRGQLPQQETGIYSYFSHKTETAKPGYYSVTLDRFGIDVELTATSRVGFHRYHFPKSDSASVVIDLEHGIGWDSPVEGSLVQVNDTVVTGYRRSSGWAKDQSVYFYAVFSKPVKSISMSDGLTAVDGTSLTGKRVYGQVFFDAEPGEPIMVKVALSPTAVDAARQNMEAELPGWDFDKTVADADAAWNSQLEKVKIETGNEAYKRIFYTALYHTMIAPSVFHDVNNDYRGSDGAIYNDPSFVNYATFSLWDTYRAAHPLMTIIHPEMVSDIGASMLNIFKQQGKLPVWHLMGNETDCMVGNPGAVVLADIVLKGFHVDKKEALRAMKTSAMLDERGMKYLKEYGYIPFDKEPTHETVAKGLEYALADWCIAQVAKSMGDEDDYKYFNERSLLYKHHFDAELQFMRGLSSDGKFREPFNPFHSVHMGDDYCEGNAWQYTWLVPHDVYGLIDLFGGDDAFVLKLDSLFVVEGDMGEKASGDITGLIGQYAHGNEPGHHIAYLYPFVGQQWKSAAKVRQILTTLYHDNPSGLSGNEDVGQMSAWYVMSAMGFYQVAPAGGVYVFGSPLMDKVTIDVGNGNKFTVIANNNSLENIYIQSVKLNGNPYSKSFILHKDIIAGGVLEIEMGSNPSSFGSEKENRPIEF
jgi:predicted alpha-1,2-mannosidase